MKNIIATIASIASLAALNPAHAQEANPAPAAPEAAAPGAAAPGAAAQEAAAPASPITWNLGAVSDYRYRGISQTRTHAAVQGGVDWVDAGTGVYAGTWLSSITWAKDAGGGGSVEMDIYAGKRGELGGGFTYDVGVLGYVYPGNDLKDVPGYVDGNTGEVYAQVGKGPYYVKYSNSLTNLFGFVDSRYSSYLDVGANLDAGNGFTIVLHGGRQHVQHSANASYTDWKVGVSRAWGATTATLAFVATNAEEAAYTSARNGKFLGKNGVTLQVVHTF